jgi:hypothetical protein
MGNQRQIRILLKAPGAAIDGRGTGSRRGDERRLASSRVVIDFAHVMPERLAARGS